MKLGIEGTIHPKDKTGFIGASVSEIGLFTQARTLKTLSHEIENAFSDLFGAKVDVTVSIRKDRTRFVLSSNDILGFYAAILKGMRGELSYREAGRKLGQKSTAALQRYEQGKTEPGIRQAFELLSGLESAHSEHIMVLMKAG